MLLGLALAFFAAKCSTPVLLLAMLFVLDLVVCAVNIPSLTFINCKDPFLLFMGVLLFKIIVTKDQKKHIKRVIEKQ